LTPSLASALHTCSANRAPSDSRTRIRRRRPTPNLRAACDVLEAARERGRSEQRAAQRHNDGLLAGGAERDASDGDIPGKIGGEVGGGRRVHPRRDWPRGWRCRTVTFPWKTPA
jgi:hypothetical protein